MVDIPDFFDPESEQVIDKQVIEHDPASSPTSIARRTALQVLYEVDTAQHEIGEVLNHHFQTYPELHDLRRDIQQISTGVHQNLAYLDAVLHTYAPEWPIDQLAVIDRNILRIALFEFGIRQRAPLSVAIDEAVELAKLFGAEGSTRFVNGVLGALADDVDAVREKLHHLKTSDSNPDETENDIYTGGSA